MPSKRKTNFPLRIETSIRALFLLLLYIIAKIWPNSSLVLIQKHKVNVFNTAILTLALIELLESVAFSNLVTSFLPNIRPGNNSVISFFVVLLAITLRLLLLEVTTPPNDAPAIS